MKILHINDTFAPAGGIQTYLIKLLPLLQTHGHDSAVIYRSEQSTAQTAKWDPLYRVEISGKPQQDRERIQEIIHQEKPDVINLHAVYDPFLITKVARLAPTVAFIHNFYPVCPAYGKYFRRGNRICERAFGIGCLPMIYLLRCASARHPRSVYKIMRITQLHKSAFQTLDHIIVASSYMRDLLIQNSFETDKISILTPHFEKRRPITEPLHDLPLLLFAGRLEQEKGLNYLLEALTYVETPCELLIAGNGTRRVEYELLAQKWRLTNQVKFVGWLDEASLQKAYSYATAFIFPSIWPEPFGKVGIEAFAHGRPVVAFDVGGISDWLIDGVNGFLVPPRDVKQLANRIDTVLKDSALAKQLGANGRQYTEQNFKPEQHIAKLLQIYELAIR